MARGLHEHELDAILAKLGARDRERLMTHLSIHRAWTPDPASGHGLELLDAVEQFYEGETVRAQAVRKAVASVRDSLVG